MTNYHCHHLKRWKSFLQWVQRVEAQLRPGFLWCFMGSVPVRHEAVNIMPRRARFPLISLLDDSIFKFNTISSHFPPCCCSIKPPWCSRRQRESGLGLMLRMWDFILDCSLWSKGGSGRLSITEDNCKLKSAGEQIIWINS